jgi:hypothetical protein
LSIAGTLRSELEELPRGTILADRDLK